MAKSRARADACVCVVLSLQAEGKQWFEAKVLKVEKRGGLIYFYLHYQVSRHDTAAQRHTHRRRTTHLLLPTDVSVVLSLSCSLVCVPPGLD